MEALKYNSIISKLSTMVGKNRFYKESKLGAKNKITYQTSNLPVTEAADHPMVPQSKLTALAKKRLVLKLHTMYQ
jgi:hypothetical protein